jgi:hypothetical protein
MAPVEISALMEHFDGAGFASAVENVKSYFLGRTTQGSVLWAGSQFQAAGSGGDRPVSCNDVDGMDVFAVTLLDIQWPAQTNANLTLGPWHDAIVHRLMQIRCNAAIYDNDAPELLRTLGTIGPVASAWREIELSYTEINNRYGLGITKRAAGIACTGTSKLLARKRPHLVPIFDSWIRERLRVTCRNYWDWYLEAFRNPVYGMNEFIEKVRQTVAPADHDGFLVHVSDLRIFDVIIWMPLARDFPNLPDATQALPRN